MVGIPTELMSATLEVSDDSYDGAINKAKDFYTQFARTQATKTDARSAKEGSTETKELIMSFRVESVVL